MVNARIQTYMGRILVLTKKKILLKALYAIVDYLLIDLRLASENWFRMHLFSNPSSINYHSL